MRPTIRFTAALLAFLLAGSAWAIWVGDRRAPFRANAPLSFELTIGAFLFLQVGSTGATVDSVQFNLTGATPTELGTGTPVPATSSGTLNIAVRGNKGAITISATNTGAPQGLANGDGDFISLAQISTQSDNPALDAPVLSNLGGTTVNVVANQFGGFVTDQTARWSYVFANTVIPLPGDYRGEVTYTASMP